MLSFSYIFFFKPVWTSMRQIGWKATEYTHPNFESIPSVMRVGLRRRGGRCCADLRRCDEGCWIFMLPTM